MASSEAEFKHCDSCPFFGLNQGGSRTLGAFLLEGGHQPGAESPYLHRGKNPNDQSHLLPVEDYLQIRHRMISKKKSSVSHFSSFPLFASQNWKTLLVQAST